MNGDNERTFAAMDELQRIAATLVRSVQAGFPEYLSSPFVVGEIHQRIIPYRLHRGALGVDTLEYYELALTRLLAGEGDYLLAPAIMREALRSELASPNPDCARYRRFAGEMVSLGKAALVLLESGHRSAAEEPDATTEQPESALPHSPAPAAELVAISEAPTPPVAVPVQASAPDSKTSRRKASPPLKSETSPPPITVNSQENPMPPLQKSTSAAEVGGKCRYCTGALPDGRALTYCPHCGQNLTIYHCPACSTELDVGWKFCVTCGRGVAD